MQAVSFGPGKAGRGACDEHAPTRFAAFVDVVDLKRHDVAAVGGAELGAGAASEQDRSTRSAHVVPRPDVERAGAFDVGESTNPARRDQLKALLPAQSAQVAVSRC